MILILFALIKKQFYECESKSIDYAVMERTNNAAVVPLDANWSDIGSWDSLWEEKVKDNNNNAIEGDVILSNVQNSYVYSSNRLVTVNSVSDIVIIDTQDALLVSNKNNSQNIKEHCPKT